MAAPAFHHVPVLLAETLAVLDVQPGGTYVDCTAGGGGHSAAVAVRLGEGGRLVALDRDPTAVAAATAQIDAALVAREATSSPSSPSPSPSLPSPSPSSPSPSPSPSSPSPSLAARPAVAVVHAPFSELGAVLEDQGVVPGSVDGILADLGTSSHQLDTADRGFSFSHDGPLDMRMDRSQGPSAADLVADLPQSELADLIFQLGDERDSRRVAWAISKRRETARIETTAELAALVEQAKGGRRGARTHPATKTFQALRMAVNNERDELHALLDQALHWLRPGGRLAVITFHSGEDRPVKRVFADWANDCICPSSSPICTCDHRAVAAPTRPRSHTATEAEIADNPRARSARLRAVVKLDAPSLERPPGASDAR